MIILLTVETGVYDRFRFDVPIKILVDLPVGDPQEQVTTFLKNTDNPDIAQFIQRVRDTADLDGMFVYKWRLLSAGSYEGPESEYGDVIDITMSPSVDEVKGRLLARDVLPENVAQVLDDNGTCLCCELSDAIYKVLTSIDQRSMLHCPTCGAAIWNPQFEMLAVMEANYYNPKHHIGLYPVCRCPNEDCKAHVALIPTEIRHNGNHDVYYTGGADYMARSFTPESAEAEILEIFEKKLWPSIKQFVERKLHPSSGPDRWMDTGLTIDDHLHLWTKRDFSHAMCEYWYKHGLKE